MNYPFTRTKLGLQIDWGLVLFLLLLAGACVARGQSVTGFGDITSRPTSICGLDQRTPAASLQLIQVSCIDFERLRALAPGYPWPVGKVTQVLIHAREGDVVRVTVGDRVQYAELLTDAWGRRIALVQFDGADYAGVAVKVYRAVEE